MPEPPPAPPPEPVSCLHFLDAVRREDGGVVQAVIDLCDAVASAGHRVTLATCDATDAPPRWAAGSGATPSVVSLPAAGRGCPLPGRLLSRRGVDRLCQALDAVQVVHLHTPWSLANLQIARLLRRRGLPYVVTIHGMLDDWCMQQKRLKKALHLRLAGRRFLKHAAAVHLTAAGELEQARRWAPIADRAAVQPCALDLSGYTPPPGPEAAMRAFPSIVTDLPRILFLSRLHPKKGIEVLIEATAILHDEQTPAQLIIAGPGEPAYVSALRAQIDRLRLANATVLLGMVRGAEKRSLTALADVFALPTHQENFGLAITEAMACGTPVVTTRGTDIWPEIQRGGARIAERTGRSFADHLKPLLIDPLLRRQAGERGRRFVREWLNPAAVTAGYERMYRDAISRGRSRPAGQSACEGRVNTSAGR